MKKFLSILLVFVMVFSMTACGKDTQDDGKDIPTSPTQSQVQSTEGDTNHGEDTEDSTDPVKDIEDELLVTESFVIPDTDDAVEGEIEFTSRNPSQVALNFVEAIAKNYYDAAVGAFNAPGIVVMSGEDIKFATPRSVLKTIADHSGKTVSLAVNPELTTNTDGRATVEVQLRDAENVVLEKFNIRLELNNDNKWFVADSDFYEVDFHLTIPGNFQLFIDGNEIDNSANMGNTGYNNLKNLYKIDVIGKAPKMIKVVADEIFAEQEVLPQSNNKDSSIDMIRNLTDEEMKAAFDATKALWEALYNDYANEVATTEWLKYFRSDFSTSSIGDIAAAFEALRAGSSGYKYINHHFTAIQKRDDAECFYIAKNTIALNFKYQRDYIWEFMTNDTRSDRHFSHIILCIEDGEYKIHTISDPDLFSGHKGFDEW